MPLANCQSISGAEWCYWHFASEIMLSDAGMHYTSCLHGNLEAAMDIVCGGGRCSQSGVTYIPAAHSALSASMPPMLAERNV